jgi:hypothetical protein
VHGSYGFIDSHNAAEYAVERFGRTRVGVDGAEYLVRFGVNHKLHHAAGLVDGVGPGHRHDLGDALARDLHPVQPHGVPLLTAAYPHDRARDGHI